MTSFKKKKRRLFKKRFKYGIAVAAIILMWGSVFFYLAFSHSSTINVSNIFSFKAAIVDHLSLSEPNQTFIQTSTSILKTAGFTVDYYEGEEVTVDFYRDLPTHGYGLIVLRVHSALIEGSSPIMGLFTSEPLSKTKYVYEQLTDQLVGAKFTDEETICFGITPLFVKQSMNGRFDNAIIILMGCDGLTDTSMAEAFIEKGAKIYISWNGSVLASHTDQAATCLFQHIVTEKQTMEEGVTETMEEVGSDPVYKSMLLCYPIERGGFVMPERSSTLIVNVAEINGQYFKRDKNVIGFFE